MVDNPSYNIYSGFSIATFDCWRIFKKKTKQESCPVEYVELELNWFTIRNWLVNHTNMRMMIFIYIYLIIIYFCNTTPHKIEK